MWVSWLAASLWPGNLEMQMVWPHSRPTEWEALGGETQHFNKPPVILMLPGSNLKTITSFNASQVFQCKQITEGSFWNSDPNSASLGWRWVCSSRRSQVMPTLLVLEPHTKKEAATEHLYAANSISSSPRENWKLKTLVSTRKLQATHCSKAKSGLFPPHPSIWLAPCE